MATRQPDDPDLDERELARFSEKLDNYEKMGLDVGNLRVLLADDLETFKATYIEEVKRQMEGGGAGPGEEGTSEEDTAEEEAVELDVTTGEGAIDEDIDLELQLEGSGPEAALAAPTEPDETDEGLEEADEALGEGPEEALEETPEAAPEEAPKEVEEVEISASDEVSVTEEEEKAPKEETEGVEIVAAEAMVTPPEEEAPEEEPEEEPEGEPGEEPEGEPEEEPEEEPGEEPEGEPEEEPEEEPGEEPEGEPEEEPLEEPEEEQEKEQEEDLLKRAEEGPEEAQAEGSEEAPEEALIVVATVVEEEAGAEMAAPSVEEESEPESEVLLEGVFAKKTPVETKEPSKPVARKVKTKVSRAVAPTVPAASVKTKKPPAKKATVGKPPAPKTSKAKKQLAKAPPTKKVVAEKPPAERVTTKPKTRRRRGLGRQSIAIILVAVIIIASAGAYFNILQNNDPTAVFTFEPDSPTVGASVTFNAGQSNDPDDDPLRFRWRFGDGTSAEGRAVSHTFLASQDYTVSLTVSDDRNGEATVRRTLSVEPLSVSMGEPMIGDDFDYDVVGNVTISNYPEGLITYREDFFTYRVDAIEAVLEGTKSFAVLDTGTAEDGFMREHDVRIEQTIYDLNAVYPSIIKTSGSLDPALTGTIYADVTESICLEWERTVKSTATVDMDMTAASYATLGTHDQGTFYAQLDGITTSFSMTEFLRTTTFYSNDHEPNPLPVGNGMYVWHVDGMERVEGRTSPALHINVTMDEDAMAEAKLDAFFTDVWLEPGLSQPSKNHVFVKGRQDGNRYTLDLTETLSTVSLGTEEVPDQCTADHLYTVKSVDSVDWSALGAVPLRGGSGGGFDFSPENALSYARSDDIQFDEWMDDRPDAFCHFGNYSEDNGIPKWTLDFGQAGSSEHYSIIVVDQDPPNKDYVLDKVKGYTEDATPLSSRGSIGEVVTLTRALRLMKEQPEIESRCFIDNEPDWTRFRFNITEAVSTISLDPVSLLAGSMEGGYVYLLISKGGDYEAALDATNGQVLFSRTHTEDFTGTPGVG